mmetsp:Transcript_19847/g.39310  ORF Transcript_19847/g.39310 Transcript_19847/m.39310 type:complete len:290 (+) Transcript_19847:310-1179(+)
MSFHQSSSSPQLSAFLTAGPAFSGRAVANDLTLKAFCDWAEALGEALDGAGLLLAPEDLVLLPHPQSSSSSSMAADFSGLAADLAGLLLVAVALLRPSHPQSSFSFFFFVTSPELSIPILLLPIPSYFAPVRFPIDTVAPAFPTELLPKPSYLAPVRFPIETVVPPLLELLPMPSYFAPVRLPIEMACGGPPPSPSNLLSPCPIPSVREPEGATNSVADWTAVPVAATTLAAALPKKLEKLDHPAEADWLTLVVSSLLLSCDFKADVLSTVFFATTVALSATTAAAFLV